MLYKDLKEYQQQNFLILRDYLKERFGDKQEDDSFYMEGFAEDGDGYGIDPKEVPECGAVCCLLGFGVLAGCKPLDQGCLSCWGLYSKDAFGLDWGVGGDTWDFLFSAMWPSDIQEAVARIEMYIDDFDSKCDAWSFSSRYTR